MNTPLRVLIVEDSEDDALLVVRELEKGGYAVKFQRVDNPKEMSTALKKQTWDIVLSDYRMPNFSGPDALALLKQTGLDIPFIAISGKIGEETAVELMLAGADDYVMKTNLTRLAPAVRRELREAEVRKERKRAEEQIISHSKFASESPAPILRVSSDGIILNYNHASLPLLLDWQTEVGKPVPEKWGRLVSEVLKFGTGKTAEVTEKDNVYLLNVIPIKDNDYVNIYAADITDLKSAEVWVQHLNRVLLTIRKVNQLIVTLDDENELLQKICETLIDGQNYKLARIGFIKEGSYDIQPVAQAGFARDYLNSLKVTWDDSEYGRSPSGMAIKTGKPAIIQDVVADESFQLWRDIALKFGFASVAALPLKIRNKTIGVLVVYSDKKATFRDDEIELLKELAGDISLGIQKIRQQNEIKQVNEKYAAVVESSNDGIIILQDGIIKFTNANMGKMAGYTASENIGKPFIDFISTRYRESVMEIYRKIITSEAVSVRNEAEIITKDNKLLPVEVNSNTIQYEGRPAVMSIIRDITERKQADNNLKKSEYKFKELFNNISSCVAVYEVLNDGENFIFKDFNQAAEKTEGIRKEELVGKLVTDVFPGVVEMGLLTVLQRVWKTGKPEHYPVSSYQDQRISGWRENFVYRLPSGEIVSAYEDVTPRKQAEAAIRESEEKYRSLYENSYDAILLTIPDGSILSANPAACLMFGRSEQEICQVGRNGIIDVTDPRVAIALKERERTGKFEGELTFVRKDGTKFPGVLSSKVFYDFQGNPRTSMIIRDITERKQAEDKLRAIVVNAPLGIATSNTDRLFLSANEAFCKIVGYTEAELQQMSFKDITHPADIRESAANMDALDANKISVFNIEKRYLKKDGTVIFGRATVNAMRSPEGRPLLYIAELEDITERKQAEEELKESQLRLEEAHRLAHIGIWNWDAAQDTVTWSKELYEIAGLDPVLPAPTYAEHTKVYTPDSFTRLSKAVEEALQTGKVYELELELVRPDGTHRWVYAFGSPKYSVDGKILGLHGTVQDISERKKAEAEINFRAEMLNAATDSIIVLDEKGRIIYFNETSYSSLGYTREEMNGKKLRNLVTAEFFSKISSQINIMLEGKKEAVFEANMVRKDKSTFPVEIHGRMVTLDNRDYIINNIRDITRRKQLDTALRISEENFRNSIDNSPFGIRIITAEGRSLYCNKALSDMWGYSSKEEFEAAPPQERYTPEDYLAYLERVAQRQKGTFTITDYEVNIKRRDGPTRFLSVARKDTIWNGSPQYMLIYQDITEQRRLEKQQELSLKVLYLLNQSGKKKELIRNLLELFKTDGQYEAVGIRLNEGDDFPYYESNGFPDDHIRTENRLCVIDDKGNLLRDSQGAAILECMCGNIIRGRFDPSKPFFTEEGSFWTNSTTNLLSSTTEADRQARTRNRCNGEGYESVALIPLKAGNTIIGLLQINDTRRNCFTEELIKYYEGLARSIGVALAQKQAEDTLIDSEAKYHNLVERANDGICILQDMRIEFCNQHLAQMWGGSVDEIAGKPFVDFVHPDSLEKVVDNYKQRMAGKDVPSIYEVSLKRKNGSRLYAELNAGTAVYKGKPANMVIIRDITERKQAEKALRESERRLKEAQALGKIGSWEFDPVTRVTTWSDEMFELYERDKTLGPPTPDELRTLYYTEEVTKIKEANQIVIESGQIFHADQTAHLPNGKTVFFHTLISPVKDEKGRVVKLFGVVQDITERKQAEKALRESERQLKEAQSLGKIANYEADIAAKNVIWSDEMYELFERDINSPPPTIDEITGYFSPEEYAKYVELSKSAYDKEGGAHRDIIARLPSGDTRIFHISIRSVKDDKGQEVKQFGTIQDVTERKNAEEMLQQERDKLELVTSSVGVGLAIISKDYHILWSNKVLQDIFRDANDEPCYSLYHARTDICPDCGVKKVFEQGKDQAIHEYFGKDAKGNTTWIQIIATPIKDKHGNITAALEAVVPITERKKAEEALRENERRLREAQAIGRIASYEINEDTKDVVWSDEMYELFERDKNLPPLTIEEITDYFSPEEYAKYDELSKRARVEGKEVHQDIIAKLPSGNTPVFYISVRILKDDKGRDVKYLGTIQDITERKKAEEELQKSYESLQKTLDGVINTISATIEIRDPYTAGHQKQVARLASAIAEEEGLPKETIKAIYTAGVIHDIGKIGIPADILSKPGKLNEIEYLLIKSRPQIGFDVLKNIEFPFPLSRWVLQHHERLNGSGYPGGLKDKEISRGARILAVADVVESMISHRPYRPGLGIEAALEEITKGKGSLYDPEAVEACIRLFKEKGFKF